MPPRPVVVGPSHGHHCNLGQSREASFRTTQPPPTDAGWMSREATSTSGGACSGPCSPIPFVAGTVERVAWWDVEFVWRAAVGEPGELRFGDRTALTTRSTCLLPMLGAST